MAGAFASVWDDPKDRTFRFPFPDSTILNNHGFRLHGFSDDDDNIRAIFALDLPWDNAQRRDDLIF